MASGLDVIIVDDDPLVCELVLGIVKRFYSWGQVHAFSAPRQALAHCRDHASGAAVFIVDVFLGGANGFAFLDALSGSFPAIHEDTVMITGNASDEVVDMCVASGVHHLLEKPIRSYALQLAVRSIVSKYLRFAKRILRDPELVRLVQEL
jgi:response regulator of citrate/malate metabolism